MRLPQLYSLIAANVGSAAQARNYSTPFKAWGGVCGSDVVEDLLPRFAELEEHFRRSKVGAVSVRGYLRYITKVLQYPEVQALLADAATGAALRDRVRASQGTWSALCKQARRSCIAGSGGSSSDDVGTPHADTAPTTTRVEDMVAYGSTAAAASDAALDAALDAASTVSTCECDDKMNDLSRPNVPWVGAGTDADADAGAGAVRAQLALDSILAFLVRQNQQVYAAMSDRSIVEQRLPHYVALVDAQTSRLIALLQQAFLSQDP
jgi:hypothetical protein